MKELGLAGIMGVVGLALLMACLFAPPPFTTTVSGPLAASGKACDGCDYQLEIGEPGSYEDYSYTVPTKPETLRLVNGIPVSVTYQDLYTGRVVLSFKQSGVTYTTPDFERYRRDLLRNWAAMAGLIVGAVAVVIGCSWFIRLGRRHGIAKGSASAALAPITLLGGLLFTPVALGLYVEAAVLVWLATAVAAVGLGLSSISTGERPKGFALVGIVAAASVSAVWCVTFLDYLAKSS